MKALDLFCGAGGASVGYHRAGFQMVGIDNRFQKNYPFDFIQADALEYVEEYGHEYDFIHASPPCQAHTKLRARHVGREYVDLVAATRAALMATGRPYVIENVPGAPLLSAITLCASMFGNDMLRRHRLFESNLFLFSLPCNHALYSERRFPPLRSSEDLAYVVGVYGCGGPSGKGGVALWREAMGIDWMTGAELSQAIPPAYTEFIGEQIMWHLESAA